MERMELFREFLLEIARGIGVDNAKALEPNSNDLKEETIARILDSMNKFLYQTYRKGERDFISKYHAFWEKNHKEILDFRIDEDKCLRVASALEEIFRKNPQSFVVSGDTQGLTRQQIANARFFTIIQDFKIRLRRDPYSIAKTRPDLFDAEKILRDFPASANELLSLLGADSQTDKRLKFARLCAQLLVEKYNGEAFNLAEAHNNRAIEIVSSLVENSDSRFSRS